MLPDFTIRAGRLQDAPCLAALGMQIWLHTYATVGISSIIAEYVLEEFTVEKFETLLDDEQAGILVAEISGHLVGYCVIRYDAPCTAADSTVEIATLYVQEHFTRSGIGTMLLHRGQSEAERRTGSRRVWLTVNIHNANAVEFYQRHGFVRVGEFWFELGGEKHENHLLVGDSTVSTG